MTNFTKKITITLYCNSIKNATIIKESLKPEIDKELDQTNIQLTQDTNMLILSIASMQTNVLRAAFNSYMRWIETASSVCQAL